MITRTFKYRLYPTTSQIKKIDNQLYLHRYLYNCALEHRITCYKNFNKSIGLYDQTYTLKNIRVEDPRFAECNRGSLVVTLMRLDKAYSNFFRRVKRGEKPGFPRFKGRGRFNSIHYGIYGNGCKIKGDRLYLQNIGEVKVRWHRPIEGRIKTVFVSRKNDKYYTGFMVETEIKPLPVTGNEIGIDVGLNDFLVTSDNLYIDNPRYFRTSEEKLKKTQQELSRRKLRSGRWYKSKKLVSGIHEKITNQRKDFHHKIARILINENDMIAVEKLQIKNMVKNKYLSKSISDAGWGEFISILKGKAEGAGREVIEVDPKGTSQRCSGCGNIVPKDLSVRIHDCPYCGLVLPRDLNSAKEVRNLALNIMQRAREAPSALALTSKVSPKTSESLNA